MRHPSRERARFTLMHLGKQAFLRRLVASCRLSGLTERERQWAGELLRALDASIAAHEKRTGIRIAEE